MTTKLKLIWIGKENRPKLDLRSFIEDPEKSCGDSKSGNVLVQGDNLPALKALEQQFAGRVRCILVDSLYHTGTVTTHPDSLIRDRLDILHRLLSEDGSLWITVNGNERPFLKVLCDEVFGRSNFVSNIVWQENYSPKPNAIWLSDNHDHMLLYAKSKEAWRPFPLPRPETIDNRYKNPDNDPRGLWKANDFTISLTGGQRSTQFAVTGESANIYEITTPSGLKLKPAKGRCWGASPRRFTELVTDNRILFGRDGNNVPALKKFLAGVQDKNAVKTIWMRDEAGDTVSPAQNLHACLGCRKCRDRHLTPPGYKIIFQR